jgi:hypothetical protein
MLPGERGVGWNLGRRGSKVVYPDVMGTRDLSPSIFLTVTHLG